MQIKIGLVSVLDVRDAVREAVFRKDPLDPHVVIANGYQDQGRVLGYVPDDAAEQAYVVLKTAMIWRRKPCGTGFLETTRFFLGSLMDQKPHLFLVLDIGSKANYARDRKDAVLFDALFQRQSPLRVSFDVDEKGRLGSFLRRHVPTNPDGHSLLEEHPYEPVAEDDKLADRLMDQFYEADELVHRVYGDCINAKLHPFAAEQVARSAFDKYRLASRFLECWREHGSPLEPIPRR